MSYIYLSVFDTRLIQCLILEMIEEAEYNLANLLLVLLKLETILST